MSRSVIGRYAMALALGLAFAAPLAPHAFAQSTNAPAASQLQEQVAKNPATSQDRNSFVPLNSELRNGDGQIVDPIYGIPLPGQSDGGY